MKPPPVDTLARLQRLLDARWTRITLAIAIIVSLLPYRAVEESLRPLLLITFGSEFLLRLTLVLRRRVRQPKVEAGFLVVDFLALLSFLPASILGVQATILRSLRVARLVVLLRFSRELARDVYQVLTRREQVRQLAFVTGAVLGLSFVAAVMLHSLGWPDAGQGDFWDRMWWAFRQVESPDNLVPSLHEHPGFVIVSLTLTIVGIFVFSYLIGLGTTIVEQVLAAEKRRPVAYEGHTLIAGPVHESEAMVDEFVRIYEKNRELRRLRPREIWRWLRGLDPRPRRHALPRITLLGPRDELPDFLYEPHMRGVVYRQGAAANEESLMLAGGEAAKRAVFLPQGSGDDADAQTVAALSAFRSMNEVAHCFVEMRRSQNAHIAESVGGNSTFVLDGPRFVGLFLAHHLTVPGAAEVFAELMSAEGNEMYTHLFADEGERRKFDAVRDASVSFSEMARVANEEHGVTLVGAFMADDQSARDEEKHLLSVTHLSPCLNPLVANEVEELEQDALPAAKVQGVFGLAPTYLPLRRAARLLTVTSPADAHPPATSDVASVLFDGAELASGPSEVVVVGGNESLFPFAESLAFFVPKLRVRVVLTEGTRPGHLTETLPEGGACEVIETEDLAVAAASEVAQDTPDAVVFMANRLADGTSARDIDAETALRVHRFITAMGDAPEPQPLEPQPLEPQPLEPQPLELLVELDDPARGEALARDVRRLYQDRCRVTPVSTSEITNYFLVHSVFVPGVMGLYERLLGMRGQDLVYLPAKSLPGDKRSLEARELREAMMARGYVSLGFRRQDGSVTLNPLPDEKIQASELHGVFVVAPSVHS